MKLNRQYFLLSLMLSAIISMPALAQDPIEECMDPEIARAFFAAQGLAAMPNYTEGPGSRVQRQHPQTYMYGQAKFIKQTDGGFAICSYSNHVGWVAIYGDKIHVPTVKVTKCEKPDCESLPRWRLEYSESSPDQDRPGQEQLHVCVENKGSVEHPSFGCRF